MQERLRHEHQTPMFPNGFGATHAIRVQAQMSFTVLIKGLDWPALQIQGDDPLGIPVHPIRHQHGIRPRQLGTLKAHHQPDLAEPGDAHGQRTCPGGVVPHGDRSVRGGRDQRDQVFHRNRWPCKSDGFPRRLLQDKAVRLQIPVLLQQAEPIFFPVAGHGHQLFSEIPTVKQEDATRDFVLHCCCQ